MPWIELLIGSYFALTIWYAIVNENYFTVPFLLLFVLGYWYTGLMSLLEGRFDRFRIGRQCRRIFTQAFSRGRLTFHTTAGCPTSRSFFARCGMPRCLPSELSIHPMR